VPCGALLSTVIPRDRTKDVDGVGSTKTAAPPHPPAGTATGRHARQPPPVASRNGRNGQTTAVDDVGTRSVPTLCLGCAD